jgi:hypothetical protein
MARVLLAAGVLFLLPLDSIAEETVIQFHVQPMAAPRPVLKYQLVPQLDELKPGNAAQNYLKCFMEQHYFFFSKQAVIDRDRYQNMPLAELARAKLDGYGGGPLTQADWAARMEGIDWQGLGSIQSGGIEAQPGELGPIQVLAKALHVRFRAEVARRDFDSAVRTAKTMFALSRHLGEHPTEVANLVGLWAAHLSLSAIGEMLQQPKCPNLYWALTDLPSPLVDLRRGIQGERTRIAAEMRLIRDDEAMSDSELESLVSRLSGLINFAREQSGQPPRAIRPALNASIKDVESLRAARRRLVEAGMKDEKVAKYPSLQVILLDQKQRYEFERDDRLKLLGVPVWQSECSTAGTKLAGGASSPLGDLLPDIDKLRAEQAELERQLALLRHVEAIRMYAASHEGRPPAKAEELSVPLPPDPLSGKPFAYSLEASTAHIRGGSPQETTRKAGHRIHCSVTVYK